MGKYTLDFTASEINNRLSKLDNTPISMELLWENASPTSAFAAQTINISDLQDYDLIMVRAKYSIGAYPSFTAFYKTTIGENNSINIVVSSIVNRGFVIKSDSISFNEANILANYAGSSSVNNNVCIPIEIYGIKGVQ